MSYLGSRSKETFLVQEQGELVVVVLCVQVYVCPRPGLVTISIIFCKLFTNKDQYGQVWSKTSTIKVASVYFG